MKKILIISLLICTFFVNAKDNLSTDNLQLKNSLLWKITGKQITKPSYLYGTMHLMCDTSTTEKAKVQSAVDATEQLYLEVDLLNPKAMNDLMKMMSEDTKIKDLKDEKKKQQLFELVEKQLGLKSKVVEETTLFTLFSMMAYKATDDCLLPTSAEETLESKFNGDRSRIAGLETMAQQMNFLNESEVASLDNTIIGLQEFDDMKEMYDDMNEYYTSENITELYELMTQPSEAFSQEYIDKMLEILLNKRNKNWVQKIPEIAAKKPTFFGVGAGHLPGLNGVINLLRQDGYTVEAVMD